MADVDSMVDDTSAGTVVDGSRDIVVGTARRTASGADTNGVVVGRSSVLVKEVAGTAMVGDDGTSSEREISGVVEGISDESEIEVVGRVAVGDGRMASNKDMDGVVDGTSAGIVVKEGKSDNTWLTSTSETPWRASTMWRSDLTYSEASAPSSPAKSSLRAASGAPNTPTL